MAPVQAIAGMVARTVDADGPLTPLERFLNLSSPGRTGSQSLLSIALDASYTHMYAPGTRRHIKAALKLGATMEEIMEVLKLCVVQGVQAVNLGIPILAEELERNTTSQKASG